MQFLNELEKEKIRIGGEERPVAFKETTMLPPGILKLLEKLRQELHRRYAATILESEA